MSYHNWFHRYFKQKYATASSQEILNEVLLLLESRGREYLEHNKEVYKQLYIDPQEDIVNSKPQIIQQVKEELRDFLELILARDVKSVLQIGLGHFGSTQFCLSLICDKIVTVEYDIRNISNYADREILYNQTKEFLIYGDSTDASVIEEAGKHGYFDCVFVDGNHSYEYVKKDYENYLPLLKSGGIFAFHDACLDADRYGTPQLLKELKEDIQIIQHSKEVGIAYFIKE